MPRQAAPKVLIVEDEQIIATDLQHSLNGMGYDAFAIAASADEALACAAAKCPDVVLMDIRIRGATDGIDTASLLKQKCPISIIYLTAHSDERMIERAKRTDPHGYLLKPVKLAELGSMIEIVLHRRELEFELARSHERMREFAQRLATVREEERRDVAARLHDGIAQELFAMKLDIGRLEGMAKRRASSFRIYQQVMRAMTRCMESTRQVANDLRPTALATFPVGAVIAQHARDFAERSGLEISVEERDGLPRLGDAQQLILFRTAQEALTNVARHAKARTVRITLRVEGGWTCMQIEDDGVGIAAGDLHRPRSLGLLGLKERFAALGGDLIVQAGEAGGTSLLARLPPPEPGS